MFAHFPYAYPAALYSSQVRFGGEAARNSNASSPLPNLDHGSVAKT